MNVKLTRNGRNGAEVLVNWDNVDFVIDTATAYGDKYAEVHCGKQTIDVTETLEQIEKKLKNEEN
tara:strand:- start:221 stop:415 length:195 start_codon:yes stop_codon:yes gene_type:complete